ncbi:MAG: DUF4389 domain-containing protein [Acidimicrobiia bacterium]|nr:DUF4389 domain-containing protein [Acidimicrobiia bacterium]
MDEVPTAPTAPASPPGAPEERHTSVGAVVLVVVGVILGFVALVLVAVGVVLLWGHTTQRDADGFFNTPTVRLETTSYAITSEEIDLGAGAEEQFVRDFGDIATVRLRADAAGEKPVFVGIARRDDADRYLGGVDRAEVDGIRTDPFSVGYSYRDGSAPSTPPGDQDIWAASTHGAGPQTLEWRPASGRWVMVVMNDDASRGVSVDASAGVKVPWILGIGIGLAAAGGVAVVIAVVLLVVGLVALARRQPIHLGGPEPGTDRPVAVEGRLDAEPSRWIWIFKWLLLIPHYIVLAVLWVAFWFVSVIAFFAILFTARYPRALFDFNVGVLRWTWRVTYYGYGVLGTDRYPPFSLGRADHPATLEVAYPERLSRGLVLIKWWLLAIPLYLLVGVFLGDGTASGTVGVPAIGLVGLLVCFAAIALLFTGRYPRGIYDLLMGVNRWVFRIAVYTSLMRDEFPPFRLDQGDREPPHEPPHSPQDEVEVEVEVSPPG